MVEWPKKTHPTKTTTTTKKKPYETTALRSKKKPNMYTSDNTNSGLPCEKTNNHKHSATVTVSQIIHCDCSRNSVSW